MADDLSSRLFRRPSICAQRSSTFTRMGGPRVIGAILLVLGASSCEATDRAFRRGTHTGGASADADSTANLLPFDCQLDAASTLCDAGAARDPSDCLECSTPEASCMNSERP